MFNDYLIYIRNTLFRKTAFYTKCLSDRIAERGERLELLIDKTEELSANVSQHRMLISRHI